MPRTSPFYRVLARAAFSAVPLVTPFSAKLARGLAGRRAAVGTFAAWASTGRDRRRPLIWCHAPSVGEGHQARAVLEVVRARHPEWQIAFTHFSPSAESDAARQPADVHAYLPPDLPSDVDAALDALAPSALVFVKLDVWPELACRAAERGIPALLVAATVSPLSARTGWPARALTRAAYTALSAAGAIAEPDAARLTMLGVSRDRITITGDPRFDSVLDLVSTSNATTLPVQRTGNPALVAGSTWGPDEEVLLEAFAAVRRALPGVRLLLAPHEPVPAHLDAVDALALRHGLPRPARVSAATGTEELILIDRVGILARLYSMGDAAYVGGGFGRAGLHSVLEPAAWGLPVLFGPRWQNSREAGLLLEAGAGIALPASASAARLAEVWLQWLDDEGSRRTAGERALQVVRSGAGGALSNAELVEKTI